MLKMLFFLDDHGVRYDNRKYGLAFTTVGQDVEKNDFFENITLDKTVNSPEEMKKCDDIRFSLTFVVCLKPFILCYIALY